ncbi:MAG: response regulator transcription factor [Novosphingobium sp.]|nr:response regulator transcription factor [Novosphingobium sp.]
MHILLVEDDEALAAHVAGGLRQSGHIVDHRADGREGLVQATCERYDVIILDRMLPNLDGLRILAALRASDDDTPVLVLSALAEVDERVRGLNAGGDDYLAKPFAFSELLARVEALGRRRSAAPEQATSLRLADLEIDLPGHTVKRGGKRIDLTAREFRILACLARNAGRVVTRAMLLEQVWDYNFDPQTNIIDQHISNLRQKIDRDHDVPLVQTVRGAGYVLRAEG